MKLTNKKKHSQGGKIIQAYVTWEKQGRDNLDCGGWLERNTQAQDK